MTVEPTRGHVPTTVAISRRSGDSPGETVLVLEQSESAVGHSNAHLVDLLQDRLSRARASGQRAEGAFLGWSATQLSRTARASAVGEPVSAW